MNWYDWLFGDRKAAYHRARRNEARETSGTEGVPETLAALSGPDHFLFGALGDGTRVEVTPDQFNGHGNVSGANGAGKSYALCVLMEELSKAGRLIDLVDPKGETVIVAALQAAAHYVDLREDKREAFASQFSVNDTREDRLTPADLFAVPPSMSPSLLATLRVAATVQVSEHDYSDLQSHGLFILFSVALALRGSITKKLARGLFLDDEFRRRKLLPKLTDVALRESVEHIEEIMPLASRQAVVRQFDIRLSSRHERIQFGLSAKAVRSLTSRSSPKIVLGNYGPSLLLAPNVARMQAINRVIDIITSATIRPGFLHQMAIIDEIGTIVRNPVVARFMLEASRTARWKGLSLVCCSQDPSNAIPREVLNTLALNARWFMAFESAKDDANLLTPYLPPIEGVSDSERRRAFFAEMATLPVQHCYFVRKGLVPLKVKVRNVPDPIATTGKSRDELLDIFYNEIAARSMVRIDDAERVIAEEERDLLNGEIAPQQQSSKPSIQSLSDLFSFLDQRQEDEER